MMRNDWSEAETYEKSALHIFIGFIMFFLSSVPIEEFKMFLILSALITAIGVFLFVQAKIQFKNKRIKKR